MEPIHLAREIEALPPEAQRQIIDFIAFLKSRYESKRSVRPHQRTRLTDEPFIGMWRNRQDMKDSTRWVRELRKREWERGACNH